MTDFVFLRIHAMPCVNRCWHCFCEGSPQGSFMEPERCLWILDQFAELKAELGTTVFPMFYDEPTLHPSFKQIMLHQLEKGLIFDEWWFSTNGYGLARMSDSDWKELAQAGFEAIRLTFHGTGGTHDELVGRKGAYEDLVKTIRKAEEHDVSWLAGMMLNTENQSAYEKTRDTVESLGKPCTDFGWMIPHSQGRALQADNRVRVGQITRLLSGKHGWVTEGEFVEKVISDPDMGNRSSLSHNCGIVYLDIDEDLNVYYGGGCDGDPYDFIKNLTYLGNMETEGISACFTKYLSDPPEPVKLLDEVTWKELAQKYGDSENDQVFHYTDFTGRKWAEAYLRDIFQDNG